LLPLTAAILKETNVTYRVSLCPDNKVERQRRQLGEGEGEGGVVDAKVEIKGLLPVWW
jgi:hypothetical protein